MGARFIPEGGPGIRARALGKSFFQPHSAVGGLVRRQSAQFCVSGDLRCRDVLFTYRSDGERLGRAQQLIISASLEALWVSSGLGAARSKPIHRRALRSQRTNKTSETTARTHPYRAGCSQSRRCAIFWGSSESTERRRFTEIDSAYVHISARESTSQKSARNAPPAIPQRELLQGEAKKCCARC